MILVSRATLLIVYAVLLAGAVAFPFVASNPYVLSVMTLAYIGALSAAGLNLLVGYTGQLNLAHAGFMAIGAYTVGVLTVDDGVPFWAAFVLAGVLAAAAGGIVGVISLRLRGHYFAIFTLCIGVIINLVIEKWEDLTHGVNGITDIPQPSAIGPIDIGNTLGQYYLALAFLVVGLVLMQRIVSSLVGRGFIAVRNSETLAEALGINLMRNKVAAFMLSTFYAGIAGALYAGATRFLGPEIASETHTFDTLTYVVVGGLGTLLGPVVGALSVSWLGQYLQVLQDYRMVVFGPLLILLIMFFPQGLVGSIATWAARRRSAHIEATLIARRAVEIPIEAGGEPPCKGKGSRVAARPHA